MQVRKMGLGVGVLAGALTSTAGLGSDKHHFKDNNGKPWHLLFVWSTLLRKQQISDEISIPPCVVGMEPKTFKMAVIT